MAEDVKSIYTTSLKNTRALEQQGLSQIEHQLSGLSAYPQYKAALEGHVPVIRKHIERLDRALDAVGESASSFKETVSGVAGKIGAAVHAVAGDETLKNLYAGYAYQYDQIAAYKSLIVIAEAAGQPQAAADFRSTLNEEQGAAEKIEGLIESVTRDYLRLATKGEKADS